MKKIIYIILFVIVIALLATHLTKQTDTEKIKIGAVLSLTGAAQADGENIKKGIEFAQLHLEEKGFDVEVVFEDDGTDPTNTVSAISKIANINKADALIGPTWSYLASASTDLIQTNELVTFSPANTSEFVDGHSDYLLYGAAKNQLKIEPTAQWIKDQEVQKVAIVLESGAWGDSHIEPFKKAAELAGAEVVAIERAPWEVTGADTQTIIAKVQDAEAEAFLFTGFDALSALFINKVKEISPGTPILAATEIVRKHQEMGTTNIEESDRVSILVPAGSDEFVKEYKKEFGIVPGAYAVEAYDGTMLLVEAISTLPEGKELNDHVREIKHKGYTGTFEFDENNDRIGGEWIVEQL